MRLGLLLPHFGSPATFEEVLDLANRLSWRASTPFGTGIIWTFVRSSSNCPETDFSIPLQRSRPSQPGHGG